MASSFDCQVTVFTVSLHNSSYCTKTVPATRRTNWEQIESTVNSRLTTPQPSPNRSGRINTHYNERLSTMVTMHSGGLPWSRLACNCSLTSVGTKDEVVKITAFPEKQAVRPVTIPCGFFPSRQFHFNEWESLMVIGANQPIFPNR